jgi:hypothetical protein
VKDCLIEVNPGNQLTGILLISRKFKTYTGCIRTSGWDCAGSSRLWSVAHERPPGLQNPEKPMWMMALPDKDDRLIENYCRAGECLDSYIVRVKT